jgi:enterochelin esterase family protein
MSMKKFMLLFAVLCCQKVLAQEFEAFLVSVNSAATDSAKTAIIDNFMSHARQAGIPFIENGTANFIYRGNATSVALELGFIYMTVNMQRLSNTNFFYYSQAFENDARLEYTFTVVAGLDTSRLVLDLENPRLAIWLGYLTSELAMPGYEMPTETFLDPAIPHGAVQNHNLFSARLNATYSIYVYSPPGYDEHSTERYLTVYAQDGQLALLGGYTNVVDNLIAQRKIQKGLLVLIPSFDSTRTATYAGERRFDYEDFVVNTVVPFIDSNYRTDKSPKGRLIGGASFGANISALIAYRHADLFGKCLMFSPALFPNGGEVFNLYANGDKKDIQFYLDWGTYEPFVSALAIPFRDVLQAKGYHHTWKEWHEGHSAGSFRAHLDNAVEFLIPANPAGVQDDHGRYLAKNFELFQNYPNPFNPETKIRFALAEAGAVSVKIFAINGEEVRMLVRGQYQAGIYSVTWDGRDNNGQAVASGVYLYQLRAGGFTQVRKMSLLR